ncbi:MAG: hypothetical protein Fur0024_1360 [Patescibacteria group bacterium]
MIDVRKMTSFGSEEKYKKLFFQIRKIEMPKNTIPVKTFPNFSQESVIKKRIKRVGIGLFVKNFSISKNFFGKINSILKLFSKDFFIAKNVK